MITVSLTFIVLFSFNCLFNSGIHKGRQHKGQLLDLSLLRVVETRIGTIVNYQTGKQLFIKPYVHMTRSWRT